MKLTWEISEQDVTGTTSFFNQLEDNCFVRKRKELLRARAKKSVTKDEFWEAMVVCLLTTQQRAGPNSHAGRFITRKPFPLAHSDCSACGEIEKFVLTKLKEHGGIRFTNTIPRQCCANFDEMETGLWDKTDSVLERLRKTRTVEAERKAAAFIQDNYEGFGPKQSRNLPQTLGLSQYEIPIDSRITKWLNNFGFPVRLSSKALSDKDYYQFVSEGFQQLCAACNILPCLLDAAIFASPDRDAWNHDTVYG